MNDDTLHALKRLRTPEPNAAARDRALDAALLAFDAEQAKRKNTAQGGAILGRLRSMISNMRGNWTMNTGMTFGLGTAAVALLLLPLGYQLYTSTAISPIAPPPVQQAAKTDAAPQEELRQESVMVNGRGVVKVPQIEMTVSAEPNAAPRGRADQDMALTASRPEATVEREVASTRKLVAPTTVAPAPQQSVSGQGSTAGALAAYAPMRDALAVPTEPSGDQFTSFAESPVKIVAEEPVSTFSIDVDTASYAYVRRALNDGYVPEPDAVRIEEMINYFSYDYPLPETAGTPFRPSVSVYPTPWNGKTEIVQIGIKGYVPPVSEDKPSNLVFLIDTSGSMDEPDKLPLLKRAFALLVEQLSANDTVSIVVYAGSAGVVLEPTKASDKAKILAALEQLSAGGSTAGAAGVELAYRLAEQHKVSNGINRVILATDGDFNVGISDPEQLKSFIKSKRDSGIFLSVLGFGRGNLGDDTMQALAQNGNGNASYIDSFREAQKVLVAEGGGTLETIAKDVKIQVEFNPAVVAEYRLIGYETRALRREDFNNDKVDAGEIGAGATVTALYEITPVGSGAEVNAPLRYGNSRPVVDANGEELGFLKLRYKLPDSDTSTLVEVPIGKDLAVATLDAAPTDSRWAAAVAAFGQKLKGSAYGEMSWEAIRALAQGARGSDEDGYRAEFMQLINMAKTVAPDPAR